MGYLDNAMVSLERRGGELVVAVLVPARSGMIGFTRTVLVALVRIAQSSPAVLSALGSVCLGDPSSCCLIILIYIYIYIYCKTFVRSLKKVLSATRVWTRCHDKTTYTLGVGLEPISPVHMFEILYVCSIKCLYLYLLTPPPPQPAP